MNIFILSLGGFIFSGYLSLVKLLSNTCALNEPCPYFFGYPACWYGFVIFSILLITSILSLNRPAFKTLLWVLFVISGIGVLFAGYFTLPEISRILSGNHYSLGLPTCAYGLIFYILIFWLSSLKLYKKN
jgi:uncharacterized membrane protein